MYICNLYVFVLNFDNIIAMLDYIKIMKKTNIQILISNWLQLHFTCNEIFYWAYNLKTRIFFIKFETLFEENGYKFNF